MLREIVENILSEENVKVVKIKRIKRDINGNPRYEVDTFEYPELKTLGNKKRGSNNIRIFSSYNVDSEIQSYFKDEKIRVEVE